MPKTEIKDLKITEINDLKKPTVQCNCLLV